MTQKKKYIAGTIALIVSIAAIAFFLIYQQNRPPENLNEHLKDKWESGSFSAD